VVGFCIECWKLLRAVGGRVEWKGGVPSLDWGGAEDAAARRTAAFKRTQEYDEIATSHLLCAMVPLSVGSAAYSLAYDTHKGWYSWLVGSLASFVYMFGFAHMVPQLYINYRLKSVAHMPWKTMMYKSLNTFIDVRVGGRRAPRAMRANARRRQLAHHTLSHTHEQARLSSRARRTCFPL
jgi:hypothetical protein